MRYYVIINGVNSLTIEGLAIRTLPPISKPAMRNLREEIDGRDGDITTELGYGAYDKTLEIGLYGDYDINKIIAFFNSKGKIIFSDEPDKYYNFEIVDKIDYTKLVKFRTATINIHCQPFKYPVSEEPQEEEYEYVEGTGENITLDNTAGAILNKIDLLGNTKQTQYTGNNLLIPHAQATGSSNGITRTTNADGSITLTGTATANAYLRISEPIQLQSNTTYTTLIQDQALPASITLYYNNLENIGTDYASTYMPPSSRAKPYTTGNVTGTTSIAVLVQSGATVNVTLKPMLVKGTYTTSNLPPYEPYVGGIPAPNPNYPEPIHVVTGDNTIEITGRQLFESEYILPQNDNNKNAHLKAGTYTLATCDGSGFGTNVYFKLFDKNNNAITTSGHLTCSNAQVNFSTSSYNYYGGAAVSLMTITLDGDYTLAIGQLNATGDRRVMLVKGTTAVRTYEPYTSQSLPLYLGGNVFKLSEIEENKAIVGTTGVINPSLVSNISGYEPVIEGLTYRLTFDYTTLLNSTDRGICYYDSNKQFVNGGNLPMTNKNQTITIADGIRYVRFAYDKNLTDINLSTDDTPIEMASIPNTDYKDTFVKEEETWYKRQVINKQIFNGDSSMLWGVNANWDEQAPALLHIFTNSLNNLWKKGQSGFLSNNFTCTTEAQRDFTKEMITCHTTNTTPYFFIKYDRLTGVTSTSPVAEKITAFNNWLRSNNTELLYLAAEETNIEITDTTLIEQLEAIKNAVSYEGQTNITQTNNDLPFILDLSALELNSDHLVVDNIGNIYSKPTLDLEGTGIVDVYLNDIQMFEVDLTENNEIIINTDEMEAFNPETGALANRQVTGDYSKIKLEPGENDLRFSGDLSKATVTKYKRWL